MKIPESELIINPDGSVFHLHLKPGEIAGNVILVGDPGRVALFAALLSDVEFSRQSREFCTVTGKFNGKRVTVLSTGIGTDNCDIVMNELDALVNVDFATREIKPEHTSLDILRVGTSGAIQPDIPLGSFVFSRMSMGCDFLLGWYAGRDRICDLEMEAAFLKHMQWNPKLGVPYFIESGADMYERFKNVAAVGVNISAPGFYGPQGRSVRVALAMPDMLDKFASFEYRGMRLTNFEMESSAIYGLGKHLGHNCGTICCILAQRKLKESNPDYGEWMKKLAALALDTLTK